MLCYGVDTGLILILETTGMNRLKTVTLLCESYGTNEQNTGGKMKVLRRVRKIRKSRYEGRHVCLSVCPHGAALLPRDGYSRTVIFEDF